MAMIKEKTQETQAHIGTSLPNLASRIKDRLGSTNWMLLPLRGKKKKKKRGRVHYRYSLDETCVCNGPLQEVAQYDALARREREGFQSTGVQQPCRVSSCHPGLSYY